MSATPEQLILSDGQVEVLAELSIDPEKVYIVRGETLHHSAVRINGYTNGHYVFFINGDASAHLTFLKYLFGDNYSAVLPSRFRGLTIYGGPTQKYVETKNLVSIATAPTSPITYVS